MEQAYAAVVVRCTSECINIRLFIVYHCLAYCSAKQPLQNISVQAARHFESDSDASEQRGADDAKPTRVGPKQMIDRREYIQVLQQALRRLGFQAVAERLERESVSPKLPVSAFNSLLKVAFSLQGTTAFSILFLVCREYRCSRKLSLSFRMQF